MGIVINLDRYLHSVCFAFPGYNSGWDIICPAGYGMPVWLALVLSGARAAGIKEAELLERESWVIGPFVPDSGAGQREENYNKEELKDEHFR